MWTARGRCSICHVALATLLTKGPVLEHRCPRAAPPTGPVPRGVGDGGLGVLALYLGSSQLSERQQLGSCS